MIAFGGALFVMTVAHPLDAGWPGLTIFPTGSRYFIIPQLAAAATLVWAVGYTHSPWRVVLAGALLYMCLVTIPSNWKYPAFEDNGFARQASQFERARPGTRIIFPLEPGGDWSMTLVKH